jgi:hypothetical protein
VASTFHTSNPTRTTIPSFTEPRRARTAGLFLAALVAAGCSGLSSDAGTGPSGGLPDVEGRWSGTFRSPSCTVSAPALEGYCAQFTAVGPQPFVLTLAQFDAELVRSLQVLDAVVPLAGTVDSSGRIRLSGTTAAPVNEAGTVTLRIRDWDTLASDGRLTGGWASDADVSATGATAQGTHVIVETTKTG